MHGSHTLLHAYRKPKPPKLIFLMLVYNRRVRVWKIKCKCMPMSNNEITNTSLFYWRNHVAYVSVGDDQETEDEMFDYIKTFKIDF